MFLKYLPQLSPVLLLALLPFSSSAQEAPAKLQTIVVTATRQPLTLEQVGGNSVTVISQEEIEKSHQTQVSELLKEVPGLDVSANGGPGTLTQFFIRGSDAKNTLVLVDGVPFNDPSSVNRAADLGPLTLDNVERIEIIRGAQSVLYGSNATAGVINIITKKGKEPTEFSVGGMVGSFQTTLGHGSVNGKSGRFNYSAAAASQRTEGFSIANDRNAMIPHDGNTGEEDSYENLTLSANIGYEFSEDHELSYLGRKITSRTDLDDWGPGYAGDQFTFDPVTFASVPEPNGDKKQRVDNTITLHALKLDNAFAQRFFQSSLKVSTTELIREGFDQQGKQSYEFTGKTRQFAWNGTFYFEQHNLTIGTDQYTEWMESLAIGEVSAETKSFWVHDQWFLQSEAWVIGLGLRNDHHEQFGTATTYRLSSSYQWNRWKLKASLGNGFRAPSLFELHSVYGNTKLDPETSMTWDVGLEHQLDRTILYGITWFDMVFQDRIVWTPIDVDPFGQYQQAEGQTRTQGAESFIAVNPAKALSLRLDHTYTHTEDPDGKRLVRRPNHKMVLKTNYRLSEVTHFNSSLQWVGERDAITSAAKKNGEAVGQLDPYTVINVAVSHDFSQNLQGYARIDNLTDEVYETAWSYATPERSVYSGVKATF